MDPDIAADDAVGLDLAADGANNDNRAYLNGLTNQPRYIPNETWKKILCHTICQSDCSWPNHRSRPFTRIRSVSRQFCQIMEISKMMLPTSYISDSTWLNQQT